VVIANRDQLSLWMEEVQFSVPSSFGPNEILINLTPGADPDEVLRTFASPPFDAGRSISRIEALSRNERNPLIAAGGTGILFVAFLAILALVAAAMLASLVTSVRRRRTEFAVVRALGMSRSQILRMLILEYGLVFAAGIAAGAFLGLVVGRQMLGFLNVTETGDKIEPSFILKTNWSVVSGGIALVVVAFALALAVAIINGNRTSDTTALRTD
jgi:putative ABC transport system permease protein